MRSKICLALSILLLMISTAFADSYEEHERRFEIFAKSVIENADRISWSGEYNFQDVEFVKSEMLGDETVYSRAWFDDYYVVIRKYKKKDWSNSFVSNFCTSSEELTFANGIKVGSPFSKVEEFFGKEHFYGSPQLRHVAQYEATDGGGMLLFSVENGRITSIGYTLLENQTSKMSFLFNLYTFFYVGEVTAEKVNVRETADNGKVRFQVSKSRGDRLLVEDTAEGDWYHVTGRILKNNKLETIPYYCISKKFVKVRKITVAERKLFTAPYKKWR